MSKLAKLAEKTRRNSLQIEKLQSEVNLISARFKALCELLPHAVWEQILKDHPDAWEKIERAQRESGV